MSKSFMGSNFMGSNFNRIASGVFGLISLVSSCCVLTGCGASVVAGKGLDASQGSFTASPNTVNFGSVSVGNSANNTVALVNTGTASVVVSNLAVSGNSSFSVPDQTQLPLTLAPGTTTNLKVSYVPTAASDDSGSLTITSNSVIVPTATVTLHGIGLKGSSAPTLSALSCSNNSITGAGTDTCTATLSAAAPSGGFNVGLVSNDAYLTVPSSVTVPANATSASFTATAAAVSIAQPGILIASANGVTQTFTVQLNPAPVSSPSNPSLSVSSSSLAFGNVALNTPAQQSLTLNSTGNAALTISKAAVTGTGFTISGPSFPMTLTPGGSASLTVKFDPTSAGTASGQITISSNSSSGGATTVALSGTGTSNNTASLSALSCSSSSMNAAGSDSCTVTLSAAAPAGGFNVNLASNNAAATVPAAVTVPANATSVGFSASVTAVSSTQSVTLTASANSVSKTFALQLNPAAPTAALSALSCSSSSMNAAGSDSCTVTLSAAAPSGGFSVNLASNNAAATVPATVTVPANATSAGFSASVTAVSSTQSVTLTASANSVSKTFALQLNAPNGQTLSINATSISFGNVTLNSPSTQSVTLNATGNTAVTVSAATVTGTGFSLPGATFPMTVNPGSSATLNVQFDPTSAGAATGQLTIANNSSNDSNAVISLSGTGTSHQVALNWTAPSSSSDPVAGYNVYRAASGSSSYQKLNSSSDGQTTYTDSTVQAGTTYQYYVTSVDSSGSESTPSNTATAVVP